MSDDDRKKQEKTHRRGLIVRALVSAIGLALVAVLLIDWNAIRFEGSPAGTIDAQLRGNPVRMEARVSGYVAHVGVDDFQRVRRGQLLYEIEQDTYRADVAQNRAALKQTDAQIAELQARIAAQDATIASAAAQAQATDASFIQAREELGRQQALRGTEGEVLRDWQRAAADAASNRATLSANRDQVREATTQRTILQAQLSQAQANRKAQHAQLDTSTINLGYTRIVAPSDGVVTARQAFTGEYVTPGRQLITFVPLDEIWAVANYREVQLAGMHVGQRAALHVDAFPRVTLMGHVDSIGPTSQSRSAALPPDRATGNFTKVVQRVPVKIVLDADDKGRVPLEGRLLPGLSVETHVYTDAP